MITDVDGELEAEIKRILQTHYLVSLKKLHNILQNTENAVLTRWANAHSSHIIPLAAVVTGSLRTWPYTLDVLRTLSSVPAFRDAVLKESPFLLNDYLEKATASHSGFENFCELCITFLAEPLPSDVGLPAVAQTFFSQVFDRAVASPSAPNVESLYVLLCGACEGLLEILPEGDLDKFREHLTRMMRTVKSVEEQLLSLFCLAIIAKINQLHSRHQQSALLSPELLESQPSPSVSLRSFTESQKFFTGERASKTVHLLVLQAIYACRGESTVSQHEASKNVKVARVVLANIDPIVIKKWVVTNRQLVQKLYQKLAQSRLDPAIQLEACVFISVLEDIETCPAQTVDTFHRLMLSIDYVSATKRDLHEALSIALPFFVPFLSDSFWSLILRRLLQTTIAETEPSNLSAWTLLVLHMRQLVVGNSRARSRLLNALTTTEIIDLTPAFLASSFNSSSSSTTWPDSASIQRQLQLDVIMLLLSAALSAKRDEVGLQSSLALQLLTKYEAITQLPSAVSDNSRRGLYARLDEQICIHHESRGSLQWREQLIAELGICDKYRQAAIIHLVEQTCHDLEERCENIEEPLRIEQKRLATLQQEHGNLRNHADQIKIELDNRIREISSLQEVKIQVDSDLAGALSDVELLTQQIKDLRAENHCAVENEQRTIFELRQHYESKKMGLAAEIACQSEKIDEQAEEIIGLQQQLLHSERALTEEGIQNECIRKSLQLSVNDLQTATANAKQVTIDKDEEIQHLTIHNDSLTDQLKCLQQEIGEITRLHTDCAATIQSLKDTSQEQLRDLQLEHQAKVRDLENKANIAEHELDLQQGLHQTEMNHLKDCADAEMRIQQQKIQELLQRIRWYEKECEEKTKELEEAQNLKTKLLTVMGHNSKPTTMSAEKLIITDTRDTAASSVVGRQRTYPAAMPLSQADNGHHKLISWSEADMQSASESTSFSGSGLVSETLRPPSKISAKAQCNTSNQILESCRTQDKRLRQPLSETSTNRSRRHVSRRSESAAKLYENRKSHTGTEQHYSDGEAEVETRLGPLFEVESSIRLMGKENPSPQKQLCDEHLNLQGLSNDDFDATTVEL